MQTVVLLARNAASLVPGVSSSPNLQSAFLLTSFQPSSLSPFSFLAVLIRQLFIKFFTPKETFTPKEDITAEKARALSHSYLPHNYPTTLPTPPLYCWAAASFRAASRFSLFQLLCGARGTWNIPWRDGIELMTLALVGGKKPTGYLWNTFKGNE